MAVEIFTDVLEDENNKYDLINVEAGERLNMADVILQFKRNRKQQSSVTGFVDVKATSNEKCIASRKGFSEWLRYAKQNNWIKGE